MSESDHVIDTTKFLYAFTKSILNSDRSIRWIGITDHFIFSININFTKNDDTQTTIMGEQDSKII